MANQKKVRAQDINATGTPDNTTFFRGDNTWSTISGTGTVTDVSVVTANGLAGTVATSTSTPAITLTTTVTGVLKGNGTAISAATAGTDYQAPITLTTTGTSGAATFISNTLNIPQYATAPGGSNTQLQYNNSGAFAGISGATTNGTAVTFTTGNLIGADVKASGSGGIQILSNAGTVTALFGAGGGANSTFYGGMKGDYLTASEIVITDASKNIISAAVATYPSLTELSYVKGVTSAIQTQLNGKQGTLTLTTTGTSGAATLIGDTLNIPNYADTDTGITQLTGDVTAGPGSGSQAATLATVNSNVGSFTYASITVNGKGLVTAASNGTSPVTSVGATGPITSSGGTTPTISTSMATGKLIGRSTAGTGVMEEITVGSGLSLSGGTLTSTGSGGDVVGPASAVNNNVVFFDGTTGKLIKDSGLTLSGNNTGDQTITLTGDVTGSGTGSFGTTLATVNSNVGSFGSATQVGTFTVNAKGLITAASDITVTPAVGSITGLGTGVATALAVNVGSAGAFVTFNGALGTPSSGTVTNLTGTASININGTVGATTPTTGSFTTVTTSGNIELGNASDTTISRVSAGVAAVEGNTIVVNTSSPTLGTITTTGSIELGNASDTTLSRSAAGVLAVEGVVIPSISSTNTLTNKFITPQLQSVADAGGTLTPVSITNDMVIATALSQATTIAAPTGSPVQGERLVIRLKDNGTARALTWNSIYRAIGVTLPTTTVISKTVYCGFIYNSSDTKWDCVAVAQEA